MTETVNVVYSVDSEHTVRAAVSAASLLACTSKEQPVCIYIIDSGLSDSERGNITAAAEKSENRDAKVVFIGGEAEALKIAKRLIRVSCDTIFDGDIREIWDFDLGGHSCGVCKRGLFGPVSEADSGIVLLDCEKYGKNDGDFRLLPLRFCLCPSIPEFLEPGDTAGLTLADAGAMYTKPVSIFFGGADKPFMVDKKPWELYFWEKFFEYKKLTAYPAVFDKIKIKAHEQFMESLLAKSFHGEYMSRFIRDAVLAAAKDIADSVKGREVIFIGANPAVAALLCGLGITPSCVADDMEAGTKFFEFDVKGGAEVFRGDLSGKFAVITHYNREIAMAYHENMMRCRCSHNVVFMSCFAADDKYDAMYKT